MWSVDRKTSARNVSQRCREGVWGGSDVAPSTDARMRRLGGVLTTSGEWRRRARSSNVACSCPVSWYGTDRGSTVGVLLKCFVSCCEEKPSKLISGRTSGGRVRGVTDASSDEFEVEPSVAVMLSKSAKLPNDSRRRRVGDTPTLPLTDGTTAGMESSAVGGWLAVNDTEGTEVGREVKWSGERESNMEVDEKMSATLSGVGECAGDTEPYCAE
mmetsp:Transcript_32169/g.80724  ORF Transcript_32169/g.80724 Transcript_32169/m.80724 type:complete len:214 (-) Transcript_32169:317-958(-)